MRLRSKLEMRLYADGSASCVQRRSRRPGNDQLQDPGVQVERYARLFCSLHEAHRLYPPIRGDSRLEKAAPRYAGEKGNLRFPLDQPIPYGLIKRITKLRVKQNRAKHTTERKKK
jgi:hypothetical protein